MIKYLISTILIVNSIFAVAQDNPLDTLFQGGSDTYNQILRNELVAPPQSMMEGHYGMSILSIQVDTTGEVQIGLMTHMDEQIDFVLIGAAQKISNGWLTKDEPYQVYQPVVFGPEGMLEYLEESIKGYESQLKHPFLTPIVVQFFVSVRVTERRESTGYGGASSTSRSSSPPSNIALGSEFPRLPNLSKLEKRINKHLEKEKNEKAYEALNEYLRYNPFDKAKLRERNRIEGLLGLSTYKTFDFNWFKTLNRLGY